MRALGVGGRLPTCDHVEVTGPTSVQQFSAPGRRIDYVMVRGGSFGPTLQARSAERFGVAGVDGVQASDHYGVVAELEVPPRLPGTWC